MEFWSKEEEVELHAVFGTVADALTSFDQNLYDAKNEAARARAGGVRGVLSGVIIVVLCNG